VTLKLTAVSALLMERTWLQ